MGHYELSEQGWSYIHKWDDLDLESIFSGKPKLVKPDCLTEHEFERIKSCN